MECKSFVDFSPLRRGDFAYAGVSGGWGAVIFFAPVLLFCLQAALLVHPDSRQVGLWILQENHPVELLTFVVFLFASVGGLFVGFRARRCGASIEVYGFYGIFSVALLFIALEEVAWGQWLFGFETPEVLRGLNVQGETTIHNLRGLQGHSEILRLIYGAGGLVGVGLARLPRFRSVGASALLLPWFVVILLHASIDVFNDVVPIEAQFDCFMQKTSEFIELLIAVSAALYFWLNLHLFVGGAEAVRACKKRPDPA